MTEASTAGPRGRRGLLAVALLLVSLNLRPSMSALSPVLGAIRRSTGLSAAGAGLLTTLPLICFGLLAPARPPPCPPEGHGRRPARLSGRVALRNHRPLDRIRRARSSAPFSSASAVAIANVLMPGIVKRDFPAQVSLMTGLYTAMLNAGAALAAGTTAPLARLFGGNWRLATGAWALPVLVAIAVILPLRSHARPSGELPSRRNPTARLWKSPVAWAVTLFMGLQSLEFYSTLAWLPTVFHDRGVSVVNAGLLLGLSNAVAIARRARHALRSPTAWADVAPRRTRSRCARGLRA